MTDSSAEPPQPAAWEKYTDLSVGEVLRRARLHYKLTLDDVAAALHIRAAQLGAVEDGKTDLLPGRVYAIGFVRAYAEYLGLDGDRMVHLFKAQSVGGRVRPELTLPIPASESKAPNLFILIGSLILLVALFGALAVMGTHHRKPAEIIPPVPAALPADMTTMLRPPLAGALAGSFAGLKNAMPAVASTPVAATRVTIKALDTAWLEIRDAQNKPLLSNILKGGDSFNVPDRPGLKLDTGNAGALQILVDGRAVPPLGKVGDVKRGLPLDPDLLKNGAALAIESPPAGQAKTAHRKGARKAAPPDAALPGNRAADHFSGVPSTAPYFNH